MRSGETNKISPGIGVAGHVIQDPLSTTAMELASEWLRECLENHSKCGTVHGTKLPTVLSTLA
jgi:hypothetical protein